MDVPYEPASDFLKTAAVGDVPFSTSGFGAENLRRLIAMTRDADVSNRDWAAMILATEELDTPEVREALIAAAGDEDMVVRAEAMLGLARRDPAIALPFVREALTGDAICMAVLEAAALVAEPSLADALRPWTEASDHPFLDQMACDSLAACISGTPPA